MQIHQSNKNIKSNHIALFIRGKVIFLFVLLYSFTNTYSQEVSKAFDSIVSLPGEYIDKLELYDKLLSSHKEKKDYKFLGNDAHELAKKIFKQDLDKAIYYNQIGLEAKSKVVPIDTCLLKTSYFNVGYYNKRKKAYKIAIEGYKKSLEFPDCRNFDRSSRRNIALSYSAIAEDFVNKEDYFYAAENYEKAIPYIDSTRLVLKINTHLNLGRVYKSLRGEKSGEKALENFFIAESFYDQLPKFKEEDKFGIYYTIAGQYLQNGKELDKASLYYDKALKLVDKVTNTEEIKRFYFNLGYSYKENDYEKAEEYCLKSLEYSDQNDPFRTRIFLGLGETSSLHGFYKESQNYYLKSLSQFLGKTFDNEPQTITKEELQKAENKELLLELFRTQMENWDRMLEKKNNETISQLIIRKAKQSDDLVSIMLRDDLSYNSKLLLRDLLSEVYILALEACYRTNNVEDAFYFIEKNKAILLIGKLKKQRNNVSKDSSTVITKSYFNNPNTIEIIKLKDVSLNENEVVINYIMAERLAGKIPDAYGIFLSDNKQQLFKIKETDKFTDKVKAFRLLLDKPFETENDKQTYFSLGNELFNLLIPKEVQGELSNKMITILGDHVINFIPFESLVPFQDKQQYLIEFNEIAYDYSLTFKKENKIIKKSASNDFLGIAPVDFFGKLVSLKESEKEVSLGEDSYSGKILSGNKATIENFKEKAKDYRILHLATHANASDTINPWIAFRNTKLKSSQLDSIKINADLVVLSACNTSLGKLNRGEGVLSLARNFFASGAKTVVPSLWEVNDKATTNITSEFYKNLSNGKSKSEALRNAKLNYLNNNSDAEASPYYWASLIVIGNTSTIKPQFQYSLYIKIGFALLIVLILFFTLKKFLK